MIFFRLSRIILGVLLFLLLVVVIVHSQDTCQANDESCQSATPQQRPLPDHFYDYDTSVDCRDEDPNCPELAAKGYCKGQAEYVNYIKTRCRKSCDNVCDKGLFDWGVQQDIPNEDTFLAVIESLEHLNGLYIKNPAMNCKNKDAKCSFWAANDECEHDPSMMQECAPACLACNGKATEKSDPSGTNQVE